MALTLASEQRRSYATPITLAAVALVLAIGAAFYFNPHRQGELSAVHTEIFNPATTFTAAAGGGMHIVGQAPQVEHDFYAVVTVHIQNDMRIPMFVDEVEGKYVAANDDEVTAIAPGTAADLGRVEDVFPKLKELLPHPLFRGDTVPPKGSLDGQVLLSLGGVKPDDWTKRKPSRITAHFAHQNPMTVVVP